MAQVYQIASPDTQTPQMSHEYVGAVVQLDFFDGSGNPVTPVGRPRVERKRLSPNTDDWVEVGRFDTNDWRFNSPCPRVRLDLSQVSGYASYRAYVWRTVHSLDITPEEVYTGTRALTVQEYPEANVKNGRQFYFRAVWPLSDQITNGPANARLLYLRTGTLPVIVKLRDLHYVAEELTIRLYVGPTGVSGGQPLTLRNYNTVNPNFAAAIGVQARKNVTVSSRGTEFDGGDPEYLFGASSAPQRVQSAIPQGRERIIAGDTEFLVAFENTGAGNARVSYFLDFYIGPPDFPL